MGATQALLCRVALFTGIYVAGIRSLWSVAGNTLCAGEGLGMDDGPVIRLSFPLSWGPAWPRRFCPRLFFPASCGGPPSARSFSGWPVGGEFGGASDGMGVVPTQRGGAAGALSGAGCGFTQRRSWVLQRRSRPVAAGQVLLRIVPLPGATPREYVAGIRSPGSVAGNIFCAGEELGTDDPVRLRSGVGVRTPGGSQGHMSSFRSPVRRLRMAPGRGVGPCPILPSHVAPENQRLVAPAPVSPPFSLRLLRPAHLMSMARSPAARSRCRGPCLPVPVCGVRGRTCAPHVRVAHPDVPAA